jgi:hypothetical protein
VGYKGLLGELVFETPRNEFERNVNHKYSYYNFV